jgi:arylsulfatase A-like enzyme
MISKSPWLLLLTLALLSPPCLHAAAERPNIVIIYADDLGYGDVGAYGATAISTPNIDRLAREGLRFVNGYAPSATCTPSRYALLTGEYPWRQKGTGILTGDANLIIQPGRTTLASILAQAGYRTAVVGKWHLGLGKGKLDWNGEIKPGPLEIGFHRSFLMPATGDRVPCVYVDGHRVVGLDPADPIEVSFGKPIPGVPTGREFPERLTMKFSHGHDQTIVNGISRIGYMKGGASALWKDEDIADEFTREAVRFIESSKDRPFFLFFSLHDPHVPRVAHPRFVGKTKLGPRGDVIVQADWCVGEILKTLERLKLAKDTLVIFTSDNGPVLDDGYEDDAVEKNRNHRPAGPLRGGKYSRFEAGCRVPFIVRWPARVKRGVSEALISQIDFPSTFAALTGQALAEGDAPDSFDLTPALLGASRTGREYVVLHASGGMALRHGDWKFIPPSSGPARASNTKIETGNDPAPQLYNLKTDPGEKRNVASANPEKIKELEERLEQIREARQTRLQR